MNVDDFMLGATASANSAHGTSNWATKSLPSATGIFRVIGYHR